MPVSLENRGAGRFAVQGELNLASVSTLWVESVRLFKQQAPRCIDLAGVSRSDSAGIALLVEWLRQARAQGQDLQFVNVPPQMLAIIKVTDLDTLLPMA
jgi:phospholipid transport system transporter-binding protein